MLVYFPMFANWKTTVGFVVAVSVVSIAANGLYKSAMKK